MHSYAAMKLDPKRMGRPNHDRGLCGFAGTLMALLDRQDYTFLDAVYDCVNNAAKIKNVDKSVRIKGRIAKRISHGIIPNETHIDDWKACLGFMILYKEYSKQHGDGNWQACVDFSEKFAGFDYARLEAKTKTGFWIFGTTTTTTHTKLKDLPSTAVMGDGLDLGSLSYKKGDFGVPPAIMPSLLALAGLAIAETKVLVQRRATLASMANWDMVKLATGTFVADMRRCQVNPGGKHHGIMLGVGAPRAARRDLEQEYNVVHWVYVPPTPTSAPSGGDFRLWSWGTEHNGKDLLANQGLVPVYAIYLA